jgi:hypothetical protein
MKDDAIARLSDQVMALTARIHEIEWNETIQRLTSSEAEIAVQCHYNR